jgi:hypothetical protein
MAADGKRTFRYAAVIVVVAVVLFAGTACKSEQKVIGAWSNASFKQVLNFKEDGSCTLKTTGGTMEGVFVFEPKSGAGTLNLLGQTMSFTIAGDVLSLVDKQGVKTEYKRGDMVIAMVTPVPTKLQTAAPTATPKATLVNKEILGIWYCANGMTVEYKVDYSYIVRLKGGGYIPGTYTYNASTNQGVMTEGGSGSQTFTFDEINKQIHFYYNGTYLTFIDEAP